MQTSLKTRVEYDPTTPSPRMFWEFCAVRMEEWWNRQTRGVPPFTDDPVLRVKPIPNIFRELDYETRWLHGQIDHLSPEEQVFGSVAFRLTAKVPPFEKFGGIPRPNEARRWAAHTWEIRKMGVPLFTRIYRTPNLWRYNELMVDLGDHIQSITKRIVEAPSLPESFKGLTALPCVKNFFAWQCTADLLETKAISFDEDGWCYLGPGPIRALHLMYGEKMNQEKALVVARRMRDVQHKALRDTYTPYRPPPHIPELKLKNIEHALCEYLRWVWAHWRL
jgi:hypothetical protein